LVKFKPIKKNPGDVIRSEDWNKIQDDLKADLEEMEDYISKMSETVTLTNAESSSGRSFSLVDLVPGEKSSYESSVMGLITKQWCLPGGEAGELCRFGVTSSFDVMHYWAGAEGGDKKALDITLEYVDGTTANVTGVFVHDRGKLRPTGTANPYLEYLLSPNERVWYKYQLVNPSPDKEVRYISFKNTVAGCTPRIGNTFTLVSRIKPLKG
jgi:hypothetical protein